MAALCSKQMAEDARNERLYYRAPPQPLLWSLKHCRPQLGTCQAVKMDSQRMHITYILHCLRFPSPGHDITWPGRT